MNRVLIAATLAWFVLPGGMAGAAETTPKPGPESGAAAAARSAEDKAAKDKQISDAMTESLRKSGFTDLQVMPNSILVRAKDRPGTRSPWSSTPPR